MWFVAEDGDPAELENGAFVGKMLHVLSAAFGNRETTGTVNFAVKYKLKAV